MAVSNPQYKVNNLAKQLNPTFYKPYLTSKPNKLLKGGRSGTKSSAISQILVEKKEKYPESNMILFRQTANSLRMSVYNQIMWALNEAGVADQYHFRTNPMTILHKERRTGFYFMGMDDPQKVKSIKIEKGYVSDLWFEEADALRDFDEIDTVQDTFIRNDLPHGLEVNTWVSYNPPRGQYHWINEWVKTLGNNPDWYVHHSTYLDDLRGYNSQQLLRKIKNYKNNDYDYYRWQYLGEVIGFGSNVYNINLFKPLKELPSDDRVVGLFYSSDGGHAVSATTHGLFGLTAKGKVILLNTYYYSPAGKINKKAPSDLSKDLNEFITKTSRQQEWQGARIMNRTIDSAEASIRNQYYKDYGQHLKPVSKKKKVDMVDYVHDLLAQGRFYYLEQPYPIGMKNADSNEVFIEEHKKYQWDEKTLNTDNPKVVKEDDHTVDMLQYLCVDNARTFRLKM